VSPERPLAGAPGAAPGAGVDDAPSMRTTYVLVVVVEVLTLLALWFFQRAYGL
jgi:hypothetical protein